MPTDLPIRAPDTAAPEDQVARMMAAGKCKQAVELAKTIHKQLGSIHSEQLLVDAYLGRIGQFLGKGLMQEAVTLRKLVEERFPSHRHRLDSVRAEEAAGRGDIGTLVAPLLRPDVSEAERLSIDAAIRRHLVDLAPLAGCELLPEDHPLRVGAAAVTRAFAEATSGPVPEERLALLEISRWSPLAGWKSPACSRSRSSWLTAGRCISMSSSPAGSTRA